MTTDNPTPTPLASTAMEAAREIRDAHFEWLNSGQAHNEISGAERMGVNANSAIIQKHFQPLLTKVEGERDEAKTEVARLLAVSKVAFDRHQKRVDDWVTIADKERVRAETAETELTALRADLAAKEAALGAARKNIELTNAIAAANISAANESRRLAVENYEDEKHRAIVLRDMLEAPLPAIPEDWNNRWIDLAIEDYASKYLKDSAPEYVTMNRHRMFNCIKTHCPDPRQIMRVEPSMDASEIRSVLEQDIIPALKAATKLDTSQTCSKVNEEACVLAMDAIKALDALASRADKGGAK